MSKVVVLLAVVLPAILLYLFTTGFENVAKLIVLAPFAWIFYLVVSRDK